jgi:hypothetical protein
VSAIAFRVAGGVYERTFGDVGFLAELTPLERSHLEYPV